MKSKTKFSKNSGEWLGNIRRRSRGDAAALGALEAARNMYKDRPRAGGRMTPVQKTASKQALFALAVFSLASVLFGWLAYHVVRQETMLFDVNTLLWLRRSIDPGFEPFARWLTNLGGVVVIPVISAFIALGLYMYGRRLSALELLFGVGGAGILNIVLKATFSRARPDLWIQSVLEQSYSFPSGHSMASAALATCLVVLVWRTPWRMTALVIGGIYVFVIGLTRMYLGVHYPTDIIAGWIVAVAWVLLVHMLFARTFRRMVTQ